MISFVWSSKYPFLAGSGGSETYTAGHIRELRRRGIDTRIITIGHGGQDGRQDFPDIPFLALESPQALAELDDTLVYITYPLAVKTKRQAYAILHCPPPNFAHGDPLYNRRNFKGVRLITASKFAAGTWRRWLKMGFGRMPTVYPYADAAFREVTRSEHVAGAHRILFAGRLKADKGIYTLLAALHMESLEERPFQLTVTTAGDNTVEGTTILKMLKAHPRVTVVPARRNPIKMAELMADHDIVVMPSTNIFWRELFGMVSIEAQQAGCRVVAARAGGLPETNLGSLILTNPDDPQALANGLAKALDLGPLTPWERKLACRRFTVEESADKLLKAIGYKESKPKRTPQLRKRPGLLSPIAPMQMKPQLERIVDRSKQVSYLPERPVQK
jgi:D-inositol-3-phosphate glycosyltransferase